MSILDTIKVKLGFSNTASENHFIDGSTPNVLSIKRGTPNSPGAEVLKINAGVVSFPQNPVQTWQNMTGSRALATNYTNSTSQPIKVAVRVTSTTTYSNSEMVVGGVTIPGSFTDITGGTTCVYVEVPVGAVYSHLNPYGSTLTSWVELR